MDLISPRVYLCGIGAVSPAGWGTMALEQALEAGEPLPIQPLERFGWEAPLRFRPVPPPRERPAFFGHPRMRRASAITHYTAAAGLEALAGLPTEIREHRLGIIVCLQVGPVQYASRLFQEILANPSMASPMLFPETVFSAPASHVAALIGEPPVATTVLGDASSFLQGLALATDWLAQGMVEVALVVSAEELNWLSADAARLFNRNGVCAAGAAAVCLTGESRLGIGAELELDNGCGTVCGCQALRKGGRGDAPTVPAGHATGIALRYAGRSARPLSGRTNSVGRLAWGAEKSAKNSRRGVCSRRRMAMRHRDSRGFEPAICCGQCQCGRMHSANHRGAVYSGIGSQSDWRSGQNNKRT